MSADAALAARILLAIGLSVVLTFTLGRLLFRLDWRGSGVIGGICAGIALGPIVLGSLAPTTYERLNVGGHEARAELDHVLLELEQSAQSLADSGVSAIAIEELHRDAQDRIQRAQEAIEAERTRFRAVPLAAVASLGLVILMLGAWQRLRLSAQGAKIGLLAGVMTALLWAALARKLTGLGIMEAIAGGALITGATVWGRGSWRSSAGIATLALVLAILVISGHARAAWPAALAVLIGGGLTLMTPISERSRKYWSLIAHAILTPSVVAIVTSTASIPNDQSEVLFVVLVGILGSDAHFVMAWIAMGWLEKGRRFFTPATAWFNLRAQGWAGTSIILLGLVMAAGVRTEQAVPEAIAWGVAASALMTEATRPAMRRILAQMRRDTKGITRP